jgi:hypothetical protein
VWGLKKLGRQRVAWRARFYDVQNRRFVWNGSWVYDVVGPGQATDFGGGPDAPQAMVHWNQYWTGGQWYEHPQGDGQQIRAVVKAAWYNARRSRWIYRSVDVRWQFSTANRTIGEGQLGPASTPVTSWVC